MRPSTLSIPMEDWPEDIRDRFQPVWDAASESQRPRLFMGTGCYEAPISDCGQIRNVGLDPVKKSNVLCVHRPRSRNAIC
ncbi:hypothetical protein CLV80_12018 [Yoonia maritima]|uniref:Uncharacterized protein n=1 Tax=Yoonia maritima TaxID=1435347 RepID=A0A2T0VTC6_9RHOB|nr:hypothetical protein CLV80_12018 [Yoonia maritima]